MFSLKINTNAGRGNEIVEPLNNILGEVLDREDVSVTGAVVSLNGKILSAADFGKSFEDLGVLPDTKVILSVVTKAVSATK